MSASREHWAQYIHHLPDPVAVALAEDIATGDVTCAAFVPAEQRSVAKIFCKHPKAIAAGVEVGKRAFELVDDSLEVRIVRPSGTELTHGDTVLEIAGPTRSILSGERTALNFIQQLSGVATLTRRFVDAVKPHAARILDTRKTTPGLRALEKAAVLAGGGTNHRFGLYDMAMAKENHVASTDLAGLAAGIRDFRKTHSGLRVEVEAQSLQNVRDFLTLEGIDVIMLDNLGLDEMREAVRLRGEREVDFEASGGVSLETVAAIAATGVEFISVGALTHSAPAIDFSLDIQPCEK